MSPADHNTPCRPVVLLTGRPGIGKTTVIRRSADLLAGRPIAGFYTDEIRVAGQRQGFRITAFSGATDTRPACRGSTFRSAPASWPWPMCTTR
jgi:nucleoside-triphosphatase THEP1